MKKILVTAANIFPYPKAGGGRGLLSFVERLSKKYAITVITPGNKNLQKIQGNYKLIAVKKPFYFKFLRSFLRTNIQNYWWHKVLKKYLKKNQENLLMAQTFLLPSVKGLNIKKIVFVRGGLHFSPSVESLDLEKVYNGKEYFKKLKFLLKIQYPLLKYFRIKSIEALKEAELIISNCNYVKKITKIHIGKDSSVLYSEVRPEKYKTKIEKNPRYLLFINPSFPKGVDIMYQIAKKLPKKDFLVVGKTDFPGKKYYKKLVDLPNVKTWGSIPDMRQAYKKTRLYIHPTRYPEGTGRTPIETMINGIPSIVSCVGGLLETVENSGDIIKNFLDVEEWVEKIKKYDNRSYYNKKSLLCKKRATQIQRKNKIQYNKIYKDIERIIKNGCRKC